jgi:hypothetical protein
MAAEFIAFKKFTDLDSSEELLMLLKENKIECHLQDETYSNVKFVGYNPIDFGFTLNIKPQDFTNANSILEAYYLKEIQKADVSYYLYEFTDAELKEIVEKPYEWGEFDFLLAKKILKERGIEISEEAIERNKEEKVAELSKVVKVSKLKLICGYIASILFPPYALISGFLIVNNRNILPNGQKVYLHSAADRTHGKVIIALSFTTTSAIILSAIIEQASR